jgi:hypothetical protein
MKCSLLNEQNYKNQAMSLSTILSFSEVMNHKVKNIIAYTSKIASSSPEK